MKKILTFMLIGIIAFTGFFGASPSISVKAAENSSAEVSSAEVQPMVYDRVWREEYFSGIMREKIFYTITLDGHQYRGYLMFAEAGVDGGYYEGWLYRYPLSYPDF